MIFGTELSKNGLRLWASFVFGSNCEDLFVFKWFKKCFCSKKFVSTNSGFFPTNLRMHSRFLTWSNLSGGLHLQMLQSLRFQRKPIFRNQQLFTRNCSLHEFKRVNWNRSGISSKTFLPILMATHCTWC